MAQRSGRNTGRRNTKSRSNSRKRTRKEEINSEIKTEVLLIGFLALAVFLFLCNFGIVGEIGDAISGILFGVFGLLSYVIPVLLFVAVGFGISNRGNYIATMKLVAGAVLFILVGVICEIISGNLNSLMDQYQIGTIYTASSTGRNGGGVLFGSIAFAMIHFLDMVGTILVTIVLGIVCVVIITEKSFLGSVKKGSRKFYDTAKEDMGRRKQTLSERRLEREKYQAALEKEEAEEAERKKRMDKRVSGVMLDTTLGEEPHSSKSKKEDMHEIILREEKEEKGNTPLEESFDFDSVPITGIPLENQATPSPHIIKPESSAIRIHKAISPIEETGEEIREIHGKEVLPIPEIAGSRGGVGADTERKNSNWKAEKLEMETAHSGGKAESKPEIKVETKPENAKKAPQKYTFPPMSLLKKGKPNSGDSEKRLRETAMQLQQTLHTFGVKVTITDISQGPTVTRYEMQPEQGVKVSKIVGLSDDIKLNLAATDIRIEAPIPGKAAVGIEVPNKENSMVALRDLLDTKEFREFSSKIPFPVGKDISGKIIVTDIGKMPHMLIAGSTGSGKSVCINSIIMGILYKAHPEDVKLIMIDPKVVELSVYNGIPHLLIPVVTDPKKAAAALHWGVAEMTERYKKFADYNVRDLKGYNKMVEEKMRQKTDDIPAKMPQIVIIVDELADLMMVAPGEVEESICRLAQLARAAGIHLIIATQRPSVDVITGLIKANMPSRVAFAVSSGVDSRTILDMNGAEKLLGKGDMLFYPQNFPKPARIQGAFVSDKEVSDVVTFLKNQAIGNVYREDVVEQISSIGEGSTAGGSSGEEHDAYFVEAGKFIIEKEKASIGMLQRVFKIGFNRAARIMDQLAEAGVVGEEEGTKPRKVLMSMEQFESYMEESV